MSTFTAERAGALAGPAWLRARRAAALERFTAAPMPTSQDELWRYAPIEGLDLGRYHLPPDDLLSGGDLATSGSAMLDGVGQQAGFLVLVDGRVLSAEVVGAAAGQGVTMGPLADGREQDGPRELPDPDALTALHDAFLPEVVVIRVPDGVVVERPILVVQRLSGPGVAAFPHLVVEAGPASEVTVVDHWISGEGDAYVSPVVEIRAGAGANVGYVGVQEFGSRVWQTGHVVAQPGRDATIRAWLLALGGEYARLYVHADLASQGGTADIAGVYFGEDRQVHDFRSLQDHRASRSQSNLLLKGAVMDEAHGIYTGLIRVHEGAKATDSFLANRNLVLGDGAHVDSVPNLEIVNENDIRSCGHASATGPVDEDHVFYLESRGVPSEVAERLIIFGFFNDVVSTVPVGEVREPLRQAVRRKLEMATARA